MSWAAALGDLELAQQNLKRAKAVLPGAAESPQAAQAQIQAAWALGKVTELLLTVRAAHADELQAQLFRKATS